ncbi:MAG: hypothetical protein ACJAZO_003961, partial [Myxococcota bacterium]
YASFCLRRWPSTGRLASYHAQVGLDSESRLWAVEFERYKTHGSVRCFRPVTLPVLRPRTMTVL